MISFARFVCRHVGQRVTAPGGLGGECVDLANLYLAEVFGAAPVRANAIDWAGIALPGWTWVPNGPTNYPSPGAIVVWRPSAGVGIGVAGHVAALVLADGFNIASLDQNWPEGAPCTLVAHSYVGVAGWHTR